MSKPNNTSRSGIHAALGVLALVLFLFTFVPSAVAGPPVHLHDPAIDIEGFNHACGTAVDSKGDVYVSSAGEAKVRVFSPAHAELTSISNSNEPCGLAVNGKGELFVAEQDTGNVVRYKPNAYPFVGTPTYGVAEPIDSSGLAKGVSIDLFDDRLYVVRGDRIVVYNADGTFAAVNEVQEVRSEPSGGSFRLAMPGEGGPSRNEVQRIVLRSAFGGSFTLSFKGQTTTPIPYDATSAEVGAALEALSTIEVGDVTVSGKPAGKNPWWVEFTGALAATDVPAISGNGAALEVNTGNSKQVAVEALSDVTGQIPFNASAGEVEAALEGLVAIGAGDVEVQQPNEARFLITFSGTLANIDVVELVPDDSELIANFIIDSELTKGFSGYVGQGKLIDPGGVAAYTHQTYSFRGSDTDRYLYAADAATDRVLLFAGTDYKALKLRREIAGPKAGEDFGFGGEGAYLAVDPGNRSSDEKCTSVDNQACTAGHLLVYDEAHKAVDEFEADGQFLDQLKDPAFADAEPTAMAIDRSGGLSDGTVYVSAGSGPAAKLLGFSPLAAPSRSPLPALSHELKNAQAVATDSHGNVYVVAGTLIHVYDPSGAEIEVGPAGKGIEDTDKPIEVAVDSTGKVYVIDSNENGGNDETVTYYTPNVYPPVDGAVYARHEPAIATSGVAVGWPSFCPVIENLAVNPANDHIFVNTDCAIREYDSAAAGHDSALLNAEVDPGFPGLTFGDVESIDVEGDSGNIYLSQTGGTIPVLNPQVTEILARIDGAGSPQGKLFGNPALAVDQSNGHVLVFENPLGAAREYDASGAFVAEFALPEPQGFTKNVQRSGDIAIDSSGGPSDGNVYIAFDDPKPGTPDVWAFGPLAYGEAPLAETGIADGLGGGNATLNGAVNPRGFELESCDFEYLTDAQYLTNGKTFAGASSVPCAETFVEIGKNSSPVAVHADLTGLNPAARYRFRLSAANKYGPSIGDAGLFGPPVLGIKSALPVLYEEATLRASVDPSGLASEYRFEYGPSESYGESTAVGKLPAGDGGLAVQADLIGLDEGTTYHFRVVAENEAGVVEGPDQTLTTLDRRAEEACPNGEFRTGLSAKLPDCRAYELVTPANTNGLSPGAPPSESGVGFNNWLTTPQGVGAGERLAYFTFGTLPGFHGNGFVDGYRAQRGVGAHPAEGWTSALFGPTYREAVPDGDHPVGGQGVAADQLYSFWKTRPRETFPETLAEGVYLRTPGGFEPVGQGRLGTDLGAQSRYVSPGGAHVIFFSDERLEEAAAPEGTVSIYDRAAGSSFADVLSLKPNGGAFGDGEGASFVATTEHASEVLFKVGGTLYLHRAGEAIEVAAGPSAFAGLSEDGRHVFYAGAIDGDTPATLYACDTQVGSCAGPEAAQEPTEIAEDSVFVNVSSDGSQVFFSSEEALTGEEENEAGETAETGEHNLYAWDAKAKATSFISRLASQDFVSFGGNIFIALDRWTTAINSPGAFLGRANSPTRSTPGGEVLVFQSHAQLTAYDNEGRSEIYRYDPAALVGERLLCVSCDPSGAPPSADAMLVAGGNVASTTLIPNLTEDGRAVFFHSRDRLLPEDANSVQDVYEWKARGGDCERGGGCLALISSGQGELDSDLYSMTPDGHDVFISTREKLVGQDIPGSPSIYDARVEGGIPDPPAEPPCRGDACQGNGSIPPVVQSPASSTLQEGGNVGGDKGGKPRCAQGKRRIVRKGKARCVSKKRKSKRHRRQADHHRRTDR